MNSMPHETQKDKRRFIEFHNLFVDYTDGDVVIKDNTKDVAALYPLKPMTNAIIFCTEGKTNIIASNIVTEVAKGDVVTCPPGCNIDSSEASEDFECKVLCLSDHIIQGLLRDHISAWQHTMHHQAPTVIHLDDNSQQEFFFYYALIHSKLKHYTQEPPYEIVQALLRALLLELCFLLEGNHGMGSDQKLSQGKLLFNKFLSLISGSEVKRKPITQYASQLAITPKYLTMLCLKYSDKTASEWVIQYTTEDIRFYLRNSNLSIKEISAKLGFANMSHFGSYVRKHLGVSPSEFRDLK
mgnify:CR=1 FL=1